MARGHAEALMPMLAVVMEEAKLDFAALDLIAATLGPGSFTGVRIAIAAAPGAGARHPSQALGDRFAHGAGAKPPGRSAVA